jgi:hypothetical protein
MDNPEKLARQVTQEKEKKQKQKQKNSQPNVRWTPLSASKHK